MRLFLERAAAVRTGFTVTGANALAVAPICHRLDGIPLAIELAAALVAVLSVGEIAARLDDRFALLTGEDPTRSERQKTLRAMIDWSYDLLSEPEQVLFRRLSVFAGGWTLPAAEAVCSSAGIEERDVLRLLFRLVGKSLVIAEEQEGETRYRLLETIREYSLDRLREAGEEADLRTRHRDWFLSLAERAEPELDGPDQAAWLHRLEWAHDILRAALERSLETDPAETGLRLASALLRFWDNFGLNREGIRWLSEMLKRAPRPTAHRAKALYALGSLISRLNNDFEAARPLLEESLEISRTLQDKPGIARALNALGSIFSLRDNARGRACREESLAIWRELGDKRGMAAALNNLGNSVYADGEHAAARALYEESLAIKREMGCKSGLINTLNNLGDMAIAQKDYAPARVYYSESLGIAQELGNKGAIATNISYLGDIAYAQGDYETARACYEESLTIWRECASKQGISFALEGLGKLACHHGDYAAARTFYEESLAIQRELGDNEGTARALAWLAILAVAQGNLEQAARLFGAAEALHLAPSSLLRIADQAEYDCSVAAAHAGLGEEAFAAARAEGQVMTMEQAVADALAGKQA